MIIICKKCGRPNRVPDIQNEAGRFSCGFCKQELIAVIAQQNKRKLPLHKNPKTLLVGGVLIGCACFIVLITSLSSLIPPRTFSSGNQNVLISSEDEQRYNPTNVSTHKYFSLPNGLELTTHRNKYGKGEISIDNGSDQDAVVKLITNGINSEPSPKTYCSVYIRAGSKTTVTHVRPGNYMVKFCAGQDWDKTKKGFTNNLSYLKFDDPFLFEERTTYSSTSKSTLYNQYRITLHGVLNGNAHTSAMSKDEFDVPEETRN